MGEKEEKNIRRLFSVYGSSYIGVFARCTENILLLPPHISDGLVGEIERALEVEAIKTFIAECSLVGSLSVGNSKGVVLSKYTLDSEIKKIEALARKKNMKIKAKKLPDKMNAVGNIILTNDTAALVHPDLSEKSLRIIEEILQVETYKGTIGSLKTVGKAAVVTNKGILAHKNAKEKELDFLEDIFGLPASIGSVNFGVPMVGAALLANTKGYVAGVETTGVELGRIEDALGFIS